MEMGFLRRLVGLHCISKSGAMAYGVRTNGLGKLEISVALPLCPWGEVRTA